MRGDTMLLRDIVTAFAPAARVDWDVDVRSLALDSRKVEPGALFFAIPGSKHDGTGFAREAVLRGAVAVVAEKDPGVSGVPVAIVPSARRALGLAADRFLGEPSRSVLAFGVTGTNGKTTTTFLLRSILAEAGLR